jgi:hypothetical protein
MERCPPACRTEHEMVQQLDALHVGGFFHPLGESPVLGARSRVAAGVGVEEGTPAAPRSRHSFKISRGST